MRTISGTLKSTPNPWLPVMSAIAPPNIRRQEATQKQHHRIENTHINIPLKTIIQSAPTTSRLKSRNPFYNSKIESFDPDKAWKEQWSENKPRGANLIEDPTNVPLPGFKKLTRKQWSTCNRIRSKQGRTASNLHRWGYKDSPACTSCNAASQNMDHIILQCPFTRIEGGYETIHEASDEFTSWLDETHMEV